MTEELTEPTPTPDEPTEAPEEKPESDDEDAALLAWARSLDPETRKQAGNLDEFHKRVNRRSMEVAAKEKALAEKPATAPSQEAASDDDDVELDERARKIIDARVEAVLKNTVLPYIVEERQSQSQKIWDDFTAKHDDVPADAIADKFYELGFDQTATTSAKYEAALEKAYKVAKAEATDIDAIVAQRVQEQIASLKQSGGEVVEVKAKKSDVEPSPKTEAEILKDPDIPWHEKMRFFNKV